MLPADSQTRVPRRNSRASLAVVAGLALGCSVAEGFKPNVAGGSGEGIAAAPVRSARARQDGPEHSLGVQWEPSLVAAMERGRREKKPVLIAFSARRQDNDFGCEF